MGTVDLIAMLALFVALASFGIWRYSRAEDNDYKKFAMKATELSSQMSLLEKSCLREKSEAFVAALSRIEKLETQTTMALVQMDELQDHCARLRKSQIELRDRSYPRHIEITFPVKGAIPVEIHGPSTPPPTPRPKPKVPTPAQAKALLKKTAKQIKGLSK